MTEYGGFRMYAVGAVNPMSLDELRAEAAKEEAEEQEPETKEEPELEESEAEEQPEEPEEGETEEEEGDSEPLKDFELQLDGEPEPGQQKPSPEEAILHKLTKERKKRQKSEDKVEALEQQIQELTQMLQGGRQPQTTQQPQPKADNLPKFPDLYDDGIEGDRDKYDKAVKSYFEQINRASQAQAQQSQQQEDYKRQMEDKTRRLAERVGKFASQHNIDSEVVVDAVERATSEIDQAAKVEGALAHLLDSVGEGSERVAYYLGRNEGAMAQIKTMLGEDQTGLKAIAHMTRMAERLKPKQSKRTSKAPEPDQPLRGDGAPKSQRDLQKKYDTASEKGDLQGMREARARAKELGVKLN